MSKVIGILYRLRNTFPLEVLKTIYKSIVLSYINYGVLLWGIEAKKSINHSEEGNTFNNWQQLCRTYRAAFHTVRCIKSLRYV